MTPETIDTIEPVVEHRHVGGSTGGAGECSAECACGVTFDGFDSHAEATALLDQHIGAGSGRKTVRADQLQPCDWLAVGPVEVLAALPISTADGAQIRVTYRAETGDLADWPVRPDAVLPLATKEEIAAARAMAKRKQALSDLETWIDWMREHPDVPMPYLALPVFADAVQVRALADRHGWRLSEEPTRTETTADFGVVRYSVAAHHRAGDGR